MGAFNDVLPKGIDKTQATCALKALGFNFSEIEVEVAMFTEADKDGNKLIEKKEFVEWVLDYVKRKEAPKDDKILTEELLDICRNADRNDDKKISEFELKKYMKNLGFDTTTLSTLFANAKKDENGLIDYEEFAKLYNDNA